MGQRADYRCVVFDLVDRVARQEQFAKLQNVQPAVGRSLCGSIVEVEPIDIYVGVQKSLQIKQKPPEGGFAPCAEATGGISRLLYHRRA